MDDQPMVTQNPIGDGVTIEFPEEYSGQKTLFALEELTVKTTNTIDSLKNTLKEAKNMLNEAMLSDQVYKNQAEALKEAQKAKKVVEANILRQERIAILAEKVKSIKSELKTKKEDQSAYALEFSTKSGASEIQVGAETYEIVKVAKLVKRMP